MSSSNSPSRPPRDAAPSGAGDNAAILELKTRARLAVNAVRRASGPGAGHPSAGDDSHELKLRDALSQVARKVGFHDWAQARTVLGGQAAPGDDLGTFWHAPRCNGLLSHWFASHAQAREALATGAHRVLVPYRRQFIVVDEHYLRELGLDPADDAWQRAGRDLVHAHGSEAWLDLCMQRLRATRG